VVVVTPDNAPFVDLVQVRAEGNFGTGLLVGRGLVLTALHCVCNPDNGWQVRNNVGVYPLRELQEGQIAVLTPDLLTPLSTIGLTTALANASVEHSGITAVAKPLRTPGYCRGALVDRALDNGDQKLLAPMTKRFGVSLRI